MINSGKKYKKGKKEVLGTEKTSRGKVIQRQVIVKSQCRYQIVNFNSGEYPLNPPF